MRSPPVEVTDDWEDAIAVAMAVCRSLADAAAVACKSNMPQVLTPEASATLPLSCPEGHAAVHTQ